MDLGGGSYGFMFKQTDNESDPEGGQKDRIFTLAMQKSSWKFDQFHKIFLAAPTKSNVSIRSPAVLPPSTHPKKQKTNKHPDSTANME